MPHCHARFVATTANATTTAAAATPAAVTTYSADSFTITYWTVSCACQFDTGAGTVPLTLTSL